MKKATDKQKLAMRNIWGRYKYDPVALKAFKVEASPGLNFMEWFMRDAPCPPEIRSDIERARTIGKCMQKGQP